MPTMPVQKGFYVSSPFGVRTGQYAGMHWGTDFGVSGGAGGRPIYAVKDGTVTRAGAASGFGQWITLDHAANVGGGLSVYGHIIPEVRVGQVVKEGQRIGYINPNSATNGGVVPHLHFEWHRYTWAPVVYGASPDRLNPVTTVLSGAGWVGDAPATSPSTPVGGDATGTIFGVDIANHQNGLPLRLAKSAGAKFCFIKATEGHTFRDPVFHSHLADARANGLQVAAYLYVWHNSTPAQMAETFAKYVNDTTVPAILDIENSSGSSVAHWKATVAELQKRGYRVPLTYLPRWYWQNVGSPSLSGLPPLWSSNYPAGGGTLSDTYRRAGGDTGAGWTGYGGLSVAMWQFTEKASVGWAQAIDGNAYKGGEAGLRALLTGTSDNNNEGDDMFSNEDRLMLSEIRNQLTGSHKVKEFPGFKLNEQAAKARQRLTKGEGLTLMDTVALNWYEDRQTGDQLSGPGRKEEARTFTGWDVSDVLNVARKRDYKGLTMAQMTVIGLFGTDADRAAVRAQINDEETA